MEELELIRELPKLEKPKWSYLGEIKVSHRETIMAEVLRYYFDPNEEHGLGNIFIRSLLETKYFDLKDKKDVTEHLYKRVESGKQILNSINNVEVNTEISTNAKTKKANSKFIDILIESEKLVICIEFKINHDLNNPLNTYQEFVKKEQEKYFEETGIKKELIFVVLTPFWKMPVGQAISNNDFVQIMLSGFIDNVKEMVNKGNYWKEKENTHQYFIYQDFINTIENRGRVVNLIKTYSEIYNDFQGLEDIEKLRKENKLDSKVLDGLAAIKESFESKTKELLKKGDKGYSLLTATKNRIDSGVAKKVGNVEYKIRLSLAGWYFEKWIAGVKDEEPKKIGDYFVTIENVIKEVEELEVNIS